MLLFRPPRRGRFTEVYKGPGAQPSLEGCGGFSASVDLSGGRKLTMVIADGDRMVLAAVEMILKQRIAAVTPLTRVLSAVESPYDAAG